MKTVIEELHNRYGPMLKRFVGLISAETFFMKNKVPKQKRKKFSEVSPAEIKSKITRPFAQQIVEFIGRYRPALEALAKR
jgi:hypothetical protein